MQLDQPPVLLVQLFNHVPLARAMSWIRDVRWAGADTTRSVSELLRERGLDRAHVGLVRAIPYKTSNAVGVSHPQLTLVDLDAEMRMLRTVRSVEEIERIRLAANLTDQSIEALAVELTPGIPENEIAAIIEPVYLRAGGYAGIHFMSSMPMRAPDFPVPARCSHTAGWHAAMCL